MDVDSVVSGLASHFYHSLFAHSMSVGGVFVTGAAGCCRRRRWLDRWRRAAALSPRRSLPAAGVGGSIAGGVNELQSVACTPSVRDCRCWGVFQIL